MVERGVEKCEKIVERSWDENDTRNRSAERWEGVHHHEVTM